MCLPLTARGSAESLTALTRSISLSKPEWGWPWATILSIFWPPEWLPEQACSCDPDSCLVLPCYSGRLQPTLWRVVEDWGLPGEEPEHTDDSYKFPNLNDHDLFWHCTRRLLKAGTITIFGSPISQKCPELSIKQLSPLQYGYTVPTTGVAILCTSRPPNTSAKYLSRP